MQAVIDTYLQCQDQLEIVQGLTSPAKIQAFLDATPYSVENTNRCPLQVLQDRLAALPGRRLVRRSHAAPAGLSTLVVDIFPELDMD